MPTHTKKRRPEAPLKPLAFEELLRAFVDRGGPPGYRHFHNAHFPGLYSIVLASDGDCLTRIFVAGPGELHTDLQSLDGVFLWHAHGYDFTETTLVGEVWNYIIEPGGTKRFFEYEIEAGIATGKPPTLSKTAKIVKFKDSKIQVRPAGHSFSMTAEPIHRVVFRACRKTGWFACVVQETNKRAAPSTVYCEHILAGVPYADLLYKEVPLEHAQLVIKALLERRREEVPTFAGLTNG